MTETFEDMQGLINSIAVRHAYRYGGIIEDLIGEANLIFVKAMNKYCPSRASVQTYLTIRITKGLLDTMRLPAKSRIRNTKSVEEEDMFYPPAAKAFSWIEFLDELSTDGKTIVRLVCEDGMCLQKQIQKHLNWNYERVRSGFDEVRKALAT